MVLLKESELVVASCGHEMTVDLSDVPVDRRQSRVDYLADRGQCGPCFKARKKREMNAAIAGEIARGNAEALAAAIEFEAGADLPPLEGTDKQLDWARRERHALLDGAHGALVFGGSMTEVQFAAAVEEPARVIARAGWWIDQRSADPLDLPDLLEAAVADDKNHASCENDV